MAGEERENERKAVVRRRSSAMVLRGDGQVVRKMKGERKATATRGNGERRGEERREAARRTETRTDERSECMGGRETRGYGRRGNTTAIACNRVDREIFITPLLSYAYK